MKRIVYNTVRSNLPTKLSINRLTQYNCKSSNQSKVIISNFIKNEIKIRLAHRVVELENLSIKALKEKKKSLRNQILHSVAEAIKEIEKRLKK